MLENIKNAIETAYLNNLAKSAAREEPDGGKLPRYMAIVSNGGERVVYSSAKFNNYAEAYLAARVAERSIDISKRIEITISKPY